MFSSYKIRQLRTSRCIHWFAKNSRQRHPVVAALATLLAIAITGAAAIQLAEKSLCRRRDHLRSDMVMNYAVMNGYLVNRDSGEF